MIRSRSYETCFVIGLLASPLCGAAVTFFAAAKKVTKESSFSVISLRRTTHSQSSSAQRLSVAVTELPGLVRGKHRDIAQRTDRHSSHPPIFASLRRRVHLVAHFRFAVPFEIVVVVAVALRLGSALALAFGLRFGLGLRGRWRTAGCWLCQTSERSADGAERSAYRFGGM